MRKRSRAALLLLGALTNSFAPAGTLAPLSSLDLHQRCLGYAQSPQSEDGVVCGTYIRAFIEGSQLVQIDRVSVPGETFSQRALRTRLGSRQAAVRYCVDSSVTVDTFVLQLLVQADDTPPTQELDASALLYATLSRFHSCSR